jgi:hypothetical protein
MTRYNSAVSTWLVIVLVVALGLPLAGTLYQQDWITSSILLATNAFVIHLFLNTYYVIGGEELRIKAGFLYTIKINIQDIKRIEKSTSLLSSPALSISDRIEVFYGKFDSVLISLKNRSGFVEDLLKVNTGIVVKL